MQAVCVPGIGAHTALNSLVQRKQLTKRIGPPSRFLNRIYWSSWSPKILHVFWKHGVALFLGVTDHEGHPLCCWNILTFGEEKFQYILFKSRLDVLASVWCRCKAMHPPFRRVLYNVYVNGLMNCYAASGAEWSACALQLKCWCLVRASCELCMRLKWTLMGWKNC